MRTKFLIRIFQICSLIISLTSLCGRLSSYELTQTNLNMKYSLLFILFGLFHIQSNAQWTEEQKILAQVPGFPFTTDGDDSMGRSVAIDGNYAIVGVPGSNLNNNSGTAFVYHWDGSAWVEDRALFSSDGAAGDQFGYSVSISGTTALVGAYFDDDNGSNSGSAYVFEKDQGGTNNWGQLAKLTASDGAVDDNFGYSVSISGTTALVGAYRDADNGSNSGSAYVFEKDQGGTNNWGQLTKLTASDGASSDNFGYSVSISGSTALVGAYGDADNGTSSGSAYVFEKDQGGTNNWGQLAKLTASDGAYSDYFGYSVAISGSTALVGAYG
ncbi:MAG: hypothetical protein ACI86P_001139, partial [Flavobacteriales bacterium]